MEQYIQTLLDMDKQCKRFKGKVIDNFYKDPKSKFLLLGFVCFTPLYQGSMRPIKGVIEIIEAFGIDVLEQEIETLKTEVHSLEDPAYLRYQSAFEDGIDYLIKVFSDKSVKKEIQDKLSILSPEEINRSNEAIHCFLENCNYSSVTMSVSAIEFRLLSLMTSTNPDPRLERLTLGQLINEYLSHKEKYRKVIPNKHESLLEHCNTYRVFSVHPKRERINRSVATSILHMSFQFLLDKELLSKSKT